MNNNTFNYTYSAKEQAEIKAIRQKYIAPEETEDKMTQLRRLDASVTQKATTVSLIFGIVGTLLTGFGMSLVMTDLGTAIGLSKAWTMLIGVMIGTIGMIPMCAAYPLYNRIVKKQREKLAPTILRLTEELMK